MNTDPNTHRKRYAWNDEDPVSKGSAITFTVATSLTLGLALLVDLL